MNDLPPLTEKGWARLKAGCGHLGASFWVLDFKVKSRPQGLYMKLPVLRRGSLSTSEGRFTNSAKKRGICLA